MSIVLLFFAGRLFSLWVSAKNFPGLESLHAMQMFVKRLVFKPRRALRAAKQVQFIIHSSSLTN